MSHIRKSIGALSAYVPGEQPSDPAVLKLNTNENPYPPPPGVKDLLARFDPQRLRLYPDPACVPVREVLARQHGCDPEQTIVGNGSDEILALCLRAFVEQGGSVGFFEPSYSLYPVLVAIQETEPRPVPLGSGFHWSMPEGFVADLFFLTQPNAPTGMLYPRHEVESFCRSFSGVVVVDEAYVEFAREHVLDLALSLPNVVAVRTLSKSCSLAGIRFGYAVGPADLVQALYKIKDSYNVNALTQDIALTALSDRDHIDANVSRIVRTRERVQDELRCRGFEVSPSQANFVWASPPGGAAGRLFEALRERKVLVRYFADPATSSHLRITVGTDEQMDRFLDEMDSVL